MNEENEKRVVEFYREGNIGIIHFNDPPLNISTSVNRKQYAEAISWAETTFDLRVVIFCNTGKCFGAGADMKAVSHKKVSSFNVPRQADVYERVTDLPMPTIAALDGSAYGGAAERALACDMRVAKKGSIISMSEVNFNAFPGSGGVPRLVDLMGWGKAMEVMLMPTRDMSVEEWQCHGVVNAVVEEGTAFELAMQWAERIAAKPFAGVRAVKEAVWSYRKPGLERYFKEQQRINTHLCASGELAVGAEEFLNKKGRSIKPTED